MTGSRERDSEEPLQEPTWTGKVVLLNEALGGRKLPYAFGGAIALNYHREPRSTLDIDINIFVAPAQALMVLDTFAKLYPITEEEQTARELEQRGQIRTTWDATYVDLFLSNTEFHTSMAARVKHEPFGDVEIPVLSVEDLLLCKVLFDRPKDWVDIDAVIATRRGQLDAQYVRGWLGRFLRPDDPRAQRIAGALGKP